MSRPLVPVVAAAVASVISAAACDRASTPSTDAPANAQVAPLVVATRDFQHLRYLEGTWRGSGGGYDGFYERYRWMDDSTIRKYGYTDSTLAVISDSSEISLRANVVRSRSPRSSYVVVALDSTRALFAPERTGSNSFEWRPAGPGAWRATLMWDSAGTPRQVVYELRAYRRP
jgi:hypothetical protein